MSHSPQRSFSPTVSLMVVSPGKAFVLKDVLLMGGEGDSWVHLFDGAEYKATIAVDNSSTRLVSRQCSFATGIVFSEGATVNIEVYGAGTTITIMGFEF